MRAWLSNGGKITALILICIFLMAGNCGCYPPEEQSSAPALLSADVVVIGGTVAAHVAALEASRNGAQVLVFWSGDEEDYPDLVGEGIIAESNVYGHDLPEEEPPLSLAEYLYNSGGQKGDMTLIKMLAARAPEAAKWLGKELKTGFKVVKEDLYYRYTFEKPLLLAEIKESLRRTAEKNGVIYFDAVNRLDLETTGQNRMELKACIANHSRMKVNTRTVIIADGGFLGNTSLMKEFAPETIDGSARTENKAMGLNIAREIEAELTEMNSFAYYPAIYVEKDKSWHRAPLLEDCFLVNKEEIISLKDKNLNAWRDVLFSRKDQTNLLVVEEASWKGGAGGEYFTRLNGPEEFEEMYGFKIPAPEQGDTNLTGILRVAPISLAAHYCLGGFRITPSGAVVTRAGTGGIYAAGEAVGGILGKKPVPGTLLPESIIFGILAGRSAAAEATS